MRKGIVILSGLVLVLLAGMLGYQYFFWEPPQLKTVALKEAIPSELPGWIVEEHKLAESEEMQSRVENILNFSEAIFRSYTRSDGVSVSVYVAYWEPRKMPIRLVQAHTPDICWVRAGWSVSDRGYSIPLTANGEPLLPAEFRLMSKDPVQQYVYYWHVVGDEVYVNRVEGEWDRLDPIKSLFRFGLNQQREQFFIRISSDRPFDNLWDDPEFQVILTSLSELALAPALVAEQTAGELPLSTITGLGGSR